MTLMRNARAAIAAAAAALSALPCAAPLGAAPSGAAPLPPVRPPPVAEAEAPPLPPRRPDVFGPPLPPPRGAFGPPAPPVEALPPAPPEPDLACGPLLAGGTAVARPAPPEAGPDGCGIAAPVRLEAVVLQDGRRVPIVPPALMRCDLAAALADWIRDDVAPAAAADGGLLAVADAAAYACRPRNGLAGARLSEHARGDAIDIAAFRFARRAVGPADASARGALAPIRASACARFATVLGPGSDRYHALVVHLDLEHRRDGYRLCQWALP